MSWQQGTGQSPAPGWYPDPSRRFEQRYWDGSRWTEHVVRQGQRSVDPPADQRADQRADQARPEERPAQPERQPERQPEPQRAAVPGWGAEARPGAGQPP